VDSPFEPDTAIDPVTGLTAAQQAAIPVPDGPEWVDELDRAAVFLSPAPEQAAEPEAGG
jgi:hypothetical protein